MKEYIFKIILLGDSGVGKTCLLHRYTRNVYSRTELTIGATFETHSLEVEPGVHVKLMLWDTAGVKSLRSVVRFQYRDCVGGLLVFDVTQRDTFENIKQWHAELCEAESEVVLVLVGNWCDDEVRRDVSREEAERLAEELGIPYVETSAKTGQNVSEAFENLTQRIYQRLSGDAPHDLNGKHCTII